ncbi:MAG: peptidoglycan editing factor PgeF [Lachnospiraceae bacterium]|nr:peptidoglycan editing factor PgeF [Lachnospiraceae bacterium]
MIKKHMPETTVYRKKDNVGYITCKALDKEDWLLNAFSTREGGISPGYYGEMNLSFTVGDAPENVRENYRLFGNAIGVTPEQMVTAAQTHTVNVLKVGKEYKGMGVVRERIYSDIDGLVTDEPGVCLVTSHADCVPLYFADRVKRCIGLSHSGWRGTVGGIGAKTVKLLEKEFGSNPKDLVCFIGPCISKESYEVGEDVALHFKNAYEPHRFEKICTPVEQNEGKYLLDLLLANFYLLCDCGLKPENITLTDICTAENRDLLHSHRATGGKRGGMSAFLMIK